MTASRRRRKETSCEAKPGLVGEDDRILEMCTGRPVRVDKTRRWVKCLWPVKRRNSGFLSDMANDTSRQEVAGVRQWSLCEVRNQKCAVVVKPASLPLVEIQLLRDGRILENLSGEKALAVFALGGWAAGRLRARGGCRLDTAAVGSRYLATSGAAPVLAQAGTCQSSDQYPAASSSQQQPAAASKQRAAPPQRSGPK